MVENISLPVVVPNKLLISAGTWNGNEYTAEEIGEGFTRTNWSDKDKISLWLNHDDKNTSAFVGYVKNPTLASEGRVFGDLEIWDEKTAILLTQAMAKFGISAKIKGEEDNKGKMQKFTFENFSVVTVPACSDAYINLAKEEEKESVSKYLISDGDIDDMLGKDEKLEKLKVEELERGEGQGVGGYSLDTPISQGSTFIKRVGTAAGMSLIMEIMKVVDVKKWEDLPGQVIRVQADQSKVHAIGHFMNNKWLDFSLFFEEFKAYKGLITE